MENIKHIYIGSDHAGYELKEKLKVFLTKSNYKVVDKGAFKLDPGDDYPDFIIPVAKSVAEDSGSFGIIIGGSGQGEAMSANKIDGIRATEYYGGDPEVVKVSRLHNDANVLSLGARFVGGEEVEEVVTLFLETKFSNDQRHVKRINKIKEEEINN